MKQIKGSARLIMYAGVAKPNPKLGQCLGPLGMNMMQFCKEFNDKTNYFRSDVPLRVLLKAYNDRTYEYKIKPPPTSWYLKRLIMSKKGVQFPNIEYQGGISVKYLYELALIKKEFDPDLKNHSVHGIFRCLLGQINSMGIFPMKDNTSFIENVTPDKF